VNDGKAAGGGVVVTLVVAAVAAGVTMVAADGWDQAAGCSVVVK
jgi:UPF0716 family protein affecting phage T7 exclusion